MLDAVLNSSAGTGRCSNVAQVLAHIWRFCIAVCAVGHVAIFPNATDGYGLQGSFGRDSESDPTRYHLTLGGGMMYCFSFMLRHSVSLNAQQLVNLTTPCKGGLVCKCVRN